MGLVQSNITLGREVELYNRVNNSDPTNAVLVAVALATTVEATSVLRTYDDLATLLAANLEVTNPNYSRLVLDDTDLDPYTVDDALGRIVLPLPLLDWSAGGGPDPGDAWDYVVICYDPDSTGGADSAIVPITYHELRLNGAALVPNGSPIVVDLTAGFVVARQYP